MASPHPYTYEICGAAPELYVLLRDADSGTEVGYMQHNGKPTWTDGIRQTFTSREEAATTAVSHGYTL